MADFNSLVSGLEQEKDDVKAYFTSFFETGRLKDYTMDPRCDRDMKKAITFMFRSKKDIRERCEIALSYEPLCLEAFFVSYILSEDIFADLLFKDYYGELDSFSELSEHQQECYIRILSFYVEFLMDIRNFSKAIKVERQIIRFTSIKNHDDVDRLSFLYSVVENADDFYRLYLDCDFDIYNYILLIVTLLKHDDEYRAKEVTLDMFENIPYTSYLDHMWDLDENDEEQKKFIEDIESLYEYIGAVPSFFSFINTLREKSEGTL